MKINFKSTSELSKDTSEVLSVLPKINLYEKLACGYERGFMGMMNFAGSIYAKERLLTDREREIAIIRVGSKTNSEYELHQHYYLALNIGITEEEFNYISKSDDLDNLTLEEQLICQAVDEYTSKFKLSSETKKEIYSTFGNEKAAELVVVIATYMQIACIIDGFGVEIEENIPLKGASKPL